MTMWQIVIVAAIACLLLKCAGYLVPQRLLSAPTPARTADLLTIALLSALVAVQTFARGEEVVIDARLPAVIVAAALYALRVPFIVVVFVAAAVAALLRLA